MSPSPYHCVVRNGSKMIKEATTVATVDWNAMDWSSICCRLTHHQPVQHAAKWCNSYKSLIASTTIGQPLLTGGISSTATCTFFQCTSNTALYCCCYLVFLELPTEDSHLMLLYLYDYCANWSHIWVRDKCHKNAITLLGNNASDYYWIDISEKGMIAA